MPGTRWTSGPRAAGSGSSRVCTQRSNFGPHSLYLFVRLCQKLPTVQRRYQGADLQNEISRSPVQVYRRTKRIGDFIIPLVPWMECAKVAIE
eukprot:833684-Rhodomonas_salina.1